MPRFAFAALALVAMPLMGSAQDKLVQLDVQPMGAPTPALKYLLLPEVRELNPGNPAQWYMRCFAEQRNFFFSKDGTAERARYLSMPLNELPKEKLEGYGGSATGQADWGARLDTLDWQVLQRVQTEGADLALPEVPPLRILGIALQVRLRGEVASKRFDNAVRTIKTMFTLSRHLGENPTVAAGEIGLAIADSTLDTLEEMLQQSGCPNLYWAFTDLPAPLVDLRKGVQGNATMVAVDFRQILGDAPMTDAQIDKVMSHLSGVIGFAREQAGQAPRNLRLELAVKIKNPDGVNAASIRLVEAGINKELTAKLSPAQIILLDEKRDYEVRRDDALKLLGLAPWQINELKTPEKSVPSGKSLFVDFLPPVAKLRKNQARLEQRIAMLRIVEALRIFATAHEGKLPENLADIGLPLPPDPLTGKEFQFKAEGAKADLRGANLHYRVAIRK